MRVRAHLLQLDLLIPHGFFFLAQFPSRKVKPKPHGATQGYVVDQASLGRPHPLWVVLWALQLKWLKHMAIQCLHATMTYTFLVIISLIHLCMMILIVSLTIQKRILIVSLMGGATTNPRITYFNKLHLSSIVQELLWNYRLIQFNMYTTHII